MKMSEGHTGGERLCKRGPTCPPANLTMMLSSFPLRYESSKGLQKIVTQDLLRTKMILFFLPRRRNETSSGGCDRGAPSLMEPAISVGEE